MATDQTSTTDAAHLEFLESETLAIVVRDGRDPICSPGCRMVSKKCPPIWCEAVYQAVRKITP